MQYQVRAYEAMGMMTWTVVANPGVPYEDTWVHVASGHYEAPDAPTTEDDIWYGLGQVVLALEDLARSARAPRPRS